MTKFALIPVLSLAAFNAFAAVPADVTTALGDAKTDVTSVGGLIVAVCVVIAAFAYMKRAIH